MLRFLFSFLFLVVSFNASANVKYLSPTQVENWFMPIQSVEVQLIDDTEGAEFLLPHASECDTLQANALDPAFMSTIDDIIAVGTKIWQIVQANQPVVSVNIPTVNALPRENGCWLAYENWQAPRNRTYEVKYKNLLGITVVYFKFRLQYTYGGSVSGRGHYLANVTIKPEDLAVSWGYTFNAGVEVGQTINLGSANDPIAGMELNLSWEVKTVLSHQQKSMQFFVRGDGQ